MTSWGPLRESGVPYPTPDELVKGMPVPKGAHAPNVHFGYNQYINELMALHGAAVPDAPYLQENGLKNDTFTKSKPDAPAGQKKSGWKWWHIMLAIGGAVLGFKALGAKALSFFK